MSLPSGFIPTLLDTLPTLVVVIDGQGRIQLFNRACERLTGYRFEEVHGRSVWQLIPPEEVPRLQAVAATLTSSGLPMELENHWVAKDGSRRLIAWRDNVVRGEDGAVQWIIGTGVDVTEQRRAEALLRQREDQFHAMFEHAPVGIALVSPQGRALTVNGQLCQMLGYSSEELTGRSFADVTHPGDVQANRELMAHARKGDVDGYPMERRYVRKDGSVVWGHLTVSRVRTGSAEDEFLIAIVADTTARKHAEQALRDSESHAQRHAAELRTIIDTVPAAIFITRDSESRHMEGNRFCSDVLRMPPGQNVSKSAPPGELPLQFRTMQAGTEIPPELLPVQIAAKQGIEVRDYELDLAFDDGSVRHLVGNASPLRSETGESCGAVGAFVDITERKRMEDELRSSRAELRAFAARLDYVREEEQARIARDLHDDMGQLLTALKMDVRWIEQKVEEPSEESRRAMLEHAMDASELVDRVIASVRRLAGELRPGVLDRLGLKSALGREVRQFHQRTGADCALVVGEDLPALGSETVTALYRIALEALTNVARHARARQVKVTLGAGERSVMLSVEDDGCGVRESPSDRTPLGIVGMRERANRLGGELHVMPRAGGGTVVTARLPLGESER